LRFHHYRDVLANAVREANTPITVGIFGPWDSGKTSLMHLVQEKLEHSRRTFVHREACTLWVNGWKDHEEDTLWRVLIIRVLDELRPCPPKADSELTQDLDDLEASFFGDVSREVVSGIQVNWEKLARGTVGSLQHLSLNLVPGVGSPMAKLVKAAQKAQIEDASVIPDAVGREVRAVRRDHIRSVGKRQERFEELEDEYLAEGNRLLVVFVDDLDWALPQKAVEALEAIKLFLDLPGCVFFVGADREVIAGRVLARYRGFLGAEGGLTGNMKSGLSPLPATTT
jgi:hypothetical protein